MTAHILWKELTLVVVQVEAFSGIPVYQHIAGKDQMQATCHQDPSQMLTWEVTASSLLLPHLKRSHLGYQIQGKKLLYQRT
jgi:hypothetical protein